MGFFLGVDIVLSLPSERVSTISRAVQTVKERICDRQILKLLRAMLAAGVMDDGVVHRADTGTLQGGLCVAAL